MVNRCLTRSMLNEPLIFSLDFAIRVHDLTGPDVSVVACPAATNAAAVQHGGSGLF